MQFPQNRCYFENCTFMASCTFGDHCDFVNCTFVKCCPKPYSNVSSVGEHARFFKCQLESVKVGPFAELYDTNQSGYLVTVVSPMPLKNTTEIRGTAKVASESEERCGQRINSETVKVGCAFQPCKQTVEGESTSDVNATVCGE